MNLNQGFIFGYPSDILWGKCFSLNDVFKLYESRKNCEDNFLLYIHIPFCLKKCSFCNIYTNGIGENYEYIEHYMNSIEKYIIKLATYFKNRKVSNIYIGGGTPTVLSVKNLEKLFILINRNFNLSKVLQINVDIHPDTITDQKIKVLSKYGVNKVLLGIQSMDSSVLNNINRSFFSYERFEKINYILKNNGINNVHIDFISGLPGEKLDIFLENIKKGIEIFSPTSININPYDHTKLTGLYSEKKLGLYTLDYFKNYFNMFIEGKKLLSKMGYKIGVTHLDDIKGNLYYKSFIETDIEILGIGAGAYSYVPKTLFFKYDNVEKFLLMDKREMLLSYIMNNEEALRKYVISVIYANGVNLNYIKKYFNEDFFVFFKKEVFFLIKLGFKFINEKGNIKIVYKNNNSFYVKLFLSVFFSEKVINKYELLEKNSYNLLKQYKKLLNYFLHYGV